MAIKLGACWRCASGSSQSPLAPLALGSHLRPGIHLQQKPRSRLRCSLRLRCNRSCGSWRHIHRAAAAPPAAAVDAAAPAAAAPRKPALAQRSPRPRCSRHRRTEWRLCCLRSLRLRLRRRLLLSRRLRPDPLRLERGRLHGCAPPLLRLDLGPRAHLGLLRHVADGLRGHHSRGDWRRVVCCLHHHPAGWRVWGAAIHIRVAIHQRPTRRGSVSAVAPTVALSKQIRTTASAIRGVTGGCSGKVHCVLVVERQREPEQSSVGLIWSCADLATHSFHQAFANTQTKPAATILTMV
mmetsp:Transcript_20682/g.48356  ORF Transcript_20682/g.48356 Transcript_20682/m.48356 type:complete len:295 (-) Transcript_20682:2067-2951(-)